MNIENVAIGKIAFEIPSKNKLFKIRKGYSKTMHNLMKKYNVKTVEDYRKIRKANRKKLRSDL